MAKTTSGDISAVLNTPSSSSSSSSPTVQFLTHLTLPSKPPDLNHNNNNFELHETDIFWSSSSETPSPANVSTSPPVHRQSSSGLYTALVRRKPNINPSQFTAISARTILPVTFKRSSEHFTGFHQSAPVNVPNWPKNETSGCLGQFDIDNMTDEDEDEDEMIPPHEIVSRSYVTFSVFEGAGRTLKGRDLCSVRNAVFQKTGFID
ncbi:hypothetical protein QVD17_08100 [Tagetes erecta]|uniref:Senescence regulator S40 n=1 Tax=Tagetes erecta TaxID=13708 RepID=A0AAD8L2L3_TARER|nr:hypothetical protein QVD17_08100 [Tagetes erecta]